MQNILNERKSNVGSPYIYYTINAEYKNRTSSTVDIDVEYISHLASGQSTLHTGTLTGYININGQARTVTLKSSSNNWDGTTKHYSYGSYTINADPQMTSLSVKFRVGRENNNGKAGTLNEISCNSISIPIGHTPPSDITFTMTETNQKLVDIGIDNNLFVENLSIKSFDNITGTTYDDATIKNYLIYNNTAAYSSTTLPITIDFKNIQLYKDTTYTNKIPIKASLLDSLDTAGFSEVVLYDYIPYQKVVINEPMTNVKRNGQMSGKVGLNVSGNFYNGVLGNIDQSAYKPIIKYKFWKLNDAEPATFDNVIPQENITIQNNIFSVSNFEIGTTDETQNNYFNPGFAYRVKVYVEDNFTNCASSEKSIAIGDATWTEYKDRVDFKKATIKNVDVATINDLKANNKVLWGPDYIYLNDTQVAQLNENVLDQKNGICLIWSAYSNGEPKNYNYACSFVPKAFVIYHEGAGIIQVLGGTAGIEESKYFYVYNDRIEGNAANNQDGYVLREVVGV